MALPLIAMLLLQFNAHGQKALEGKVLLAVFSHPDDEGTIAPILAKYSRQGAQVHLVTVTDGRYGSNEFNNFIEDEELAAVRREELKCSAATLGAELTHLKYHDQLKAAEGFDGHISQARGIIEDLNGIIEEVEPDVLITWGPDGWTNHMDHRLVGASVTQVFLSKDWKKPVSLYYCGIPFNAIEDAEERIYYGVAEKYLKTKVAFSDEDMDKAYQSFRCHKSQIDPKMTKEDLFREWYKGVRYIYLRKFEGPKKNSDTVFD
ncbi:PIG-L deacetylase family protein [Flagellimonas iocasae]|uniref:PIG-L deacetylase family protein n=1 Tax=Flagellimonas iocasae TaxID=2055905 RepID=A0ABW4Y555_9FLAO